MAIKYDILSLLAKCSSCQKFQFAGWKYNKPKELSNRINFIN
jgi:hypothetical protein